jgi:hypothetical protein
MIFNNNLSKIWCFICNAYKDPNTEIYLPDGSENKGRVSCLKCDSILGYTFDLNWKRYWEGK